MNAIHDLDQADFQEHFATLIEQVPKDERAEYSFFDVPCDRKPWLDTGLDLTEGQFVTSFAVGKTRLLGADFWLGADFQLWFRIGEDGEVFRGTRASHTFTAERAGRLYLGSYFPGEWSTRTGDLATPDDAYLQASGHLAVLILRWRVTPRQGLCQLAAIGNVHGLIASEIDRLSHPRETPRGWHYLWFVGPAEIYQPCRTPENIPAICCQTHRDAGLLQREIALPLAPDTRLRWTWRIDRLPSEVREDTLPTHDYLSMAVEFDNGQDITYFWSAELPPDAGFRCPIPTWTARETHVVVRSGTEHLGRWLTEERNVYRDYRHYIGGPLPVSIVRVWLIAVSLFQGRNGEARYADMAFVTDAGKVPISVAD